MRQFILSLLLISIFFGCSSEKLLSSKEANDLTKENNLNSEIIHEPTQAKKQFTFGWQFVDSNDMKPRGGTTFGPKVTIDDSLNKDWVSIREPNINKFERDRRSILAMQGAYRVSFDFVETIGFTHPYKPKAPYQTWGTEFVYLVEDSGNFISLQHIIVMFFESRLENSSDEISGPMVVKHWRQDWKFEDTMQNLYAGFNTWKRVNLSLNDVSESWSQSVYQVDDSPRYQAYGKWQHTANYSRWESNETWRPLPRREFSVRSDYDVLIGTNNHVITPSGWVQEEENLKVKLEKPGVLVKNNSILAKEMGIARYERIINHDWSAGDEYWNQTKIFWKDVRGIWSKLLEENKTLVIKKKSDSPPLFMAMFSLAEEAKSGKNGPIQKEKIKSTINNYLED